MIMKHLSNVAYNTGRPSKKVRRTKQKNYALLSPPLTFCLSSVIKQLIISLKKNFREI